MQADTGPSGLSSALTYDIGNLPGLVAGDIELYEGPGLLSDIVRFNPNEVYPDGGTGVLVFYSDIDETGAIADTGFPRSVYMNNLILFESDFGGGLHGLIYTPAAGQPGYVPGLADLVTYTFASETKTVPEPTTLAVVGSRLAAIAHGLRRKLRR